MDGLLVVDVEVDGERVDVRCADGVVSEIAPDLTPRHGEEVVRGASAAIPGLHDHHLHLMAMAARAESLDIGADQLSGPDELRRVMSGADATLPAGEWIRAVGFHE